MLSFINNKETSFYKVNLKELFGFKHLHTLTLFELLLDFQRPKQDTTLFFNFNFLRKIFGLENKYLKDSEFEKKVVSRIVQNLNEREEFSLELFRKKNNPILKINVKKTSTNYKLNNSKQRIYEWLEKNPIEMELYKQCLCTDNNIQLNQLKFEEVKQQGKRFFLIFSYKSFLLEVEMEKEDLQTIFKEVNENVNV
jgi:hypothetical protein